MRKKIVSAYILATAMLMALSLMLVGCSADKATLPPRPAVSGTPLLGTTWRIVEINGVKTGFLPGQKLDLSLVLSKGGQFRGSTGCNHLNGAYVRNADRLSFGSLFITRIASTPQLMERERVFLDALRKVNGYAIHGSRLKLFSSGGQKIMELLALGKF